MTSQPPHLFALTPSADIDELSAGAFSPRSTLPTSLELRLYWNPRLVHFQVAT
jgi:hypothetical protein